MWHSNATLKLPFSHLLASYLVTKLNQMRKEGNKSYEEGENGLYYILEIEEAIRKAKKRNTIFMDSRTSQL